MMRIGLFLLTNLAVIALAAIVLQLLGVESFLQQQGTQLNLEALFIFALVFGMAGSFVSLAISKWIAIRSTGAMVIEEPKDEQQAWLKRTVERMANEAGIGVPDVAIYPGPELNAFATGARRDSALVAVSQGLLQHMSRDEAEAVIGHEISHIANGDMITMALLQGVLNTFVIFFSRIIGFIVDRVVFRTERGLGIGYYIVSIVAQILLGILASMIAMWFSRRREFRADAGGAALAGRARMIAALERLHAGAPSTLPSQMQAFGIRGELATGLRRLMMSHPPIDERIQALKEGTS